MQLRTEGNKIYIYGYIWDGDGRYFASAFSKVDGMYDTVEVHLHTYGGSVFDGNLIYNMLINAKSIIDTYVDGVAASMGFILMLAGRNRYMAENAFAMSHTASGYTSGDAKAHESSANLLREIEKSFLRKLVAITGKTAKQCKKWLDGDNWFSAEQALNAKLITEVIGKLEDIEMDDDPTALTSKDIYARFVASSSLTNSKEKPLKGQTMKKEIIASFGLVAVNEQSSDTAVLVALTAKFNANTSEYKGKYEQEVVAHNNLKAVMSSQSEVRIDAMVNLAFAQGKITELEKATYKKVGSDSGLDTLEAIFKGMQARKTITGAITGGANIIAAKEGWNWDKYQKEDPQALEDMRTSNLDAFKAIYKAKFKVDYTD